MRTAAERGGGGGGGGGRAAGEVEAMNIVGEIKGKVRVIRVTHPSE